MHPLHIYHAMTLSPRYPRTCKLAQHLSNDARQQNVYIIPTRQLQHCCFYHAEPAESFKCINAVVLTPLSFFPASVSFTFSFATHFDDWDMPTNTLQASISRTVDKTVNKYVLQTERNGYSVIYSKTRLPQQDPSHQLGVLLWLLKSIRLFCR